MKANQLDYHAQLENYMKLTAINNNSNEQLQNQIYFNQSPQQVNFNPSPQFQSNQNYQAPPYANIPQQQSQPTQSNSQNQNKEEFFNKFGSKYDAHKNKLKNDLHQEYNEYLQKVSAFPTRLVSLKLSLNSNPIKKNSNSKNQRNAAPAADEKFYATLPLKGMDSAKVIL